MASLRDNFDQLFQHLRQGRGISNTGDDPVYYLIFPPHEMLEVKRRIKEWEAKLKIQGWTMETFSMAEAIHEIFQANEFRDVWLASEMNRSFDPDSVHSISETLSDVVKSVTARYATPMRHSRQTEECWLDPPLPAIPAQALMRSPCRKHGKTLITSERASKL